MLFFVVLLNFEYIVISSKKWSVICMMNWGMVLCAIAYPIEVARCPIKYKLALRLAET